MASSLRSTCESNFEVDAILAGEVLGANPTVHTAKQRLNQIEQHEQFERRITPLKARHPKLAKINPNAFKPEAFERVKRMALHVIVEDKSE